MKSIDVGTLKARLAAGEAPLLVDVRTRGEFAGGHVPEAINLPLSGLGGTLDGLRDRGTVHLICRSGARSAQAASILEQAGLETVNVEGGTSAWVGAGYPVKSERSLWRLLFPGLLALTVGLAPMVPEPHLVGKLRWVAGGAVDMGLVDWGDLALHGLPWVWLAWAVAAYLRTPAD